MAVWAMNPIPASQVAGHRGTGFWAHSPAPHPTAVLGWPEGPSWGAVASRPWVLLGCALGLGSRPGPVGWGGSAPQQDPDLLLFPSISLCRLEKWK